MFEQVSRVFLCFLLYLDTQKVKYLWPKMDSSRYGGWPSCYFEFQAIQSPRHISNFLDYQYGKNLLKIIHYSEATSHYNLNSARSSCQDEVLVAWINWAVLDRNSRVGLFSWLGQFNQLDWIQLPESLMQSPASRVSNL